MQKNTWAAKISRNLKAVFLAIAENRRGQCKQCGACCCLPVRCVFLKDRDDGTQYCSIYGLRPPTCRKYPRIPTEFLTKEVCGFYFVTPQETVVHETPQCEVGVPVVD